MIKRIFPLTLFLCSCILGFAQTPTKVITGDYQYQQNFSGSMVCPPGANPDAGISTQTLFPSAQSNNVQYLCMGDSMDVLHFGGDLSGDPQPASAPGFSYVFYSCPPTVNGPNWSTILLDPCHIVDPFSFPTPTITSVQQGVDIDGNATFFNNGQVQTAFNSGAPIEVWFAPMTFDDFASFGPEEDPTTMELGPCMNINTADAFSVVYLNEITGTNINTMANGDCTGSFVVEGGLPEFDMTNYTNVSITLSTDPSVEADVMGSNFTHGETIEFTVPQPGIYNVLIEDGVSCAANFTVDMTACTAVTFSASNEFADNGETVCIQIAVSDFTSVLSFQFTVNWDPTVLQYNSVNNPNVLSDLNFGPASPTDALTVSWFDAGFTGITLADGTVIYEICFDVIGAPGDVSPITFSGDLTEIEVLNPNLEEMGFIGQEGSVTVTGIVTAVFTSCSSPAGGPDVGKFNITISGGVPPYTYSWEDQATGTITGSGSIAVSGGTDTVGDGIPGGDDPLPPGTYSVTITDSNGDIEEALVEIFNAPQLNVAITGTNPTCSYSMDGTMEIDFVLGGVNPLDTAWSTGDMGVSMISGLTSGQYFLTVTDAAGCAVTVSDGIGVMALEIDTVSLVHIPCNGGPNDGSAEVVASGGTLNPGSDYVYNWTTGDMGPSISNQPAGSYCVTVTDDNMCELVHCLTIFPPMPPVVTSWDSISVNCPGDMNGELTVHATPGGAPIDSWTWDPPFPGADSTITGIGPGTYYVTITAQDGCEAIDSATLYAPQFLMEDSVEIMSPNCPGDNNGTIAVFISGGVEPYTYAWSTGIVGAFPLLPGLVGDSTYMVTVTDSGNCGDELVLSIFLPDPPSIGVQFTNEVAVSCNNGIPCDGQATAIAFGGTAGTGTYNYNWVSGESEMGVMQSTATQLCQGWQSIEINDGLCSITDSVFIDAPSALTVDVANTFSTPTSCFGASDGAATVLASGGTPGYTYQWVNPNVSGPMITGVPADTFFVVITDAAGCTFPFTIEVGQPDSLVASINAANTNDISCAGDSDGQIEVSWTGGNAGSATYQWTNNVSSSSVATQLAVGTYTVTVTDQNGCSDEATYSVSEPPPVTFEIMPIPQPECFGFQTFIAIDTAYGGTGGNNLPFFFSVDGGPRQPIIGTIPILAGDHTVTVFDSDGCFTEQTVSVSEPPPLIVDLGPDVEIELGDSILLEPVIGSFLPIDSLVWTPFTALTCDLPDCSEVWADPLEETLYTLTVTDINGCIGFDDIIVDVDKNRNIFIPNVFTPDGDGFNDFFRVFAGVGVQSINYVQVYDRWGEKLFERRNLDPVIDTTTDGWDGYFKGKLMNPGVYVYLVEVEFADGLVLLYRGDITLLH